MSNRSDKPTTLVKVRQSIQITDSHCGAAVIQMLLDHVGITVTQEAVAEAAGATATIEEQGMRVDQLALAVKNLAPQMQFWYKDHSRIKDLTTLIKKYRYPVGVEWQGLFESPDEILNDDDDEDDESDYGHYSIVTHIDRQSEQLVIVDPYKDFADQDRIFPIEVFRRRWWDTNEVTNPATGKKRYVVDDRMMFIITPGAARFPLELEMKRG